MNKKVAIGLAIVWLIVSVFIIHVVDREPWFDVSFSLETAHKLNTEGFDSIDFKHYDVHSPVFYYLLAVWQKIPTALSKYHQAQWFVAFLWLGFVMLSYASLTILFGELVGAITVFMMLLSSTYLHYGTEVRGYMLLMLMSSYCLYFLVSRKDESGPHFWLFGLTLLMFPMVHYFGFMAVPFFMVLWFLLKLHDTNPVARTIEWKKRNVHIFIRWSIFVVMGLSWALTYAVPQKLRTQGNWFQSPNIADWPGSVFYSFFMPDNIQSTQSTVVIYAAILVIFMVFVGWIMIRVMKSIGKDMLRKDVILLMMVLTAFAPLAGLASTSLLSGDGFAHLYHHRFFLVLTWMFAAASLGLITESLIVKNENSGGVWWIVMSIMIGFMFLSYWGSAHHELGNLMERTPCQTFDGGYIPIAHESPFSALPYEVYAREHGCVWWNFVSTNLTERQGHGAGFDAMDSGSIFYNRTLPMVEEAPYYLYVKAAGSVPIDGEEKEIAAEDGVSLVMVNRTQHSTGLNTG